MNVSRGYDTTLYHHPVGVFAGIAPWNFPAMIPHGWMTPICLATGNTMVLKAASFVLQSSIRLMELWQEAGLPDGVLNVITTGREQAEILLKNPAVKSVSFVGSTKVGQHIYATAAANGKRVQALCEAKNHALVLRDCKLERTARGIINAFCGCAGERCMALPVVVVENVIADELTQMLVKFAFGMKLGPAYEKSTDIGPVVNAGHLKFVTDWIKIGVDEGASLILDGRNPNVPGYEKGFYIGPTIFDHVTEDMSIGREEIFGPVICIKRVDNFEEGLTIMNNSRFANGSVIYTQNGHYAREFAKRTDGGMVGINVGIPVPVGLFGFTGHKNSFFGDLHVMGKDGFSFYTESKCVTSTWFPEDETECKKVDTWDGTMACLPDAVEDRLRKDYTPILNPNDVLYSSDEIIKHARGADAIMPCHTERFGADVIASLPESVRVIANFSVGYDHVDIQAARARGLIVTNTPEVLSDATAELTMMLILGASRRASEGERLVRTREWKDWSPSFMVGTQVTGKRLGILGFGRVGRVVARRARGFDMEIHYNDVKRMPHELEEGAIFHKTPAELMPHCDFLALHCVASPQTIKLLNAELIALLPDGAIVVNASRGVVIDDDALIAALKSGKLTAAGLDVYNNEPDIHPEYRQLSNVFLMPHIGSATKETRIAMGFRALDNLDAVFAGHEPRDRVA